MNKNADKFQNVKRIIALIGAGLLALMYIVTLVSAIVDNPATMSYFKASVTLTIFIPVFIYAYQLVYRVIKSYSGNDEK